MQNGNSMFRNSKIAEEWQVVGWGLPHTDEVNPTAWGKPHPTAFPNTKTIHQGAVTLLELMFATAILGIALVTLGVAVGRCLRGVAAADRVQMALDVARGRLAEWRAQAEREREMQTGTEAGERIVRGQRFAWRQVVESSDDPDLLTSRLSIRWKEGNLERNRTFVELVRKSNPKRK